MEKHVDRDTSISGMEGYCFWCLFHTSQPCQTLTGYPWYFWLPVLCSVYKILSKPPNQKKGSNCVLVYTSLPYFIWVNDFPTQLCGTIFYPVWGSCWEVFYQCNCWLTTVLWGFAWQRRMEAHWNRVRNLSVDTIIDWCLYCYKLQVLFSRATFI